jgi:ABC-type glycerol-3-phosphate transport system permease component
MSAAASPLGESRPARLALDAASLAIGFLWLAPILWMLSTALKPSAEIYSVPPYWIPTRPTLTHFASSLAAAPFGLYSLNSVLVAGVTTLLTVLAASMAGYALARLPYRGRWFVMGGMLSSTMIPFQVLLIPFFILLTALKLVNTRAGLVLAYVTIMLPFAVFMFRAYFLDLPREVEESARLDGCSWLGVYWRIALPLARPAIAAVGIYTFIESWNEFFIAFVLTNSQSMRTLPVGLALLRNEVQGIDWGQVMAGSVMAAIPAIAVFLVLQRQIIAGLTGGAIKG